MYMQKLYIQKLYIIIYKLFIYNCKSMADGFWDLALSQGSLPAIPASSRRVPRSLRTFCQHLARKNSTFLIISRNDLKNFAAPAAPKTLYITYLYIIFGLYITFLYIIENSKTEVIYNYI